MAVVGSSIMAERLSGGIVGLALLANSLATGGALVALILAFGPISGGHFNPAVTLAVAMQSGIGWREVPGYLVLQIAGAFAGVPQGWSEFVATFGLLAVIWGCERVRSSYAPFAVGLYIMAAYWFTSSTSFA